MVKPMATAYSSLLVTEMQGLPIDMKVNILVMSRMDRAQLGDAFHSFESSAAISSFFSAGAMAVSLSAHFIEELRQVPEN
jgi:hypothetical protein